MNVLLRTLFCIGCLFVVCGLVLQSADAGCSPACGGGSSDPRENCGPSCYDQDYCTQVPGGPGTKCLCQAYSGSFCNTCWCVPDAFGVCHCD